MKNGNARDLQSQGRVIAQRVFTALRSNRVTSLLRFPRVVAAIIVRQVWGGGGDAGGASAHPLTLSVQRRGGGFSSPLLGAVSAPFRQTRPGWRQILDDVSVVIVTGIVPLMLGGGRSLAEVVLGPGSWGGDAIPHAGGLDGDDEIRTVGDHHVCDLQVRHKEHDIQTTTLVVIKQFLMKLSIVKNPFPTKNQTLRSYKVQ